MPEIKFGNETIEYTIRESQRARRISLRIDPRNGLQIVLPAGVKQNDFSNILRERQRWILKHLKRMEAQQPIATEQGYISGITMPYLGKELRLDIENGSKRKRTHIRQADDALYIRLGQGINIKQEQLEIRAALEHWYRQQAKAYLPARTAELAHKHGFEYGRITIRNQKTRWGSCSDKRNLNYNLRLMMTPPAAIDYIIIHELCHLRHLNHSRKFWDLVKHYCPEYKQWVTWFKENSARLVI